MSMATAAGGIGLAVVVLGLCAIKSRRKKKVIKERRYWERPHLGIVKRAVYGQYNMLQQMRVSDVDSFKSIIRLRPDSFDELLALVGPTITHYSNREPISPAVRLAVTLRYLATGESQKSLSYNYRLGISTTHNIINETIVAIANALKPIMLPEMTTEKWLEVADGFNSRWNVPNCGGPVDGKHIRCKKPKHSGSEYFNYKKFFSVVMMALCDHKFRFTAADVGCQGRHNDAIVLSHSKIGEKLVNGTFNLPGEREIMDGPVLPHFLLGDEIFGLQPYLMVPYPGRGTGKLSYNEKTFNYRQARGRRVIEISFGIFSQVWSIFLTTINATPEQIDMIVMAAVCLHNFRIDQNEINDFQENYFCGKPKRRSLESISEFPELHNMSTDSRRAKSIRDELARYFTMGGRVYWQEEFIH